MINDVSDYTVFATFEDRTAAEIACALLTDASIHADEPEGADGRWTVTLRGMTADVSARSEVILRSARARTVEVMMHEPQRAA